MPFLLSLVCFALSAAESPTYDVVIYGGTSAGVIAAVKTAQLGKSVVLIEPTRRLGGLTTGGLGATDIGNKLAIGGLSREFYHRVWLHYQQPQAWKQDTAEAFRARRGRPIDEDTMWCFEPHVAEAIYERWIADARVPVVRGERLDLVRGVRKSGPRITAIVMESGKTFAGRVFIDATYEGDLLAKAGVSYTVGREPNAQYGETLNGVQPGQAKYHQFLPGVDPFVVKGDAQSGLLPFIEKRPLAADGSGDRRVQAYCYRMCLTDDPQNRIPFHKPAGYEERWYDLLLRNFEAGERGMPWINTPMPNRKTDTNNRTGFSTDFIGQNYAFPDASHAQRDEIARRHRLYQQGLMWTLANHPRVPEKIRSEVARWGMCKDEFREGAGWQEQLYVREARRMVSDCVMSERHCRGELLADDAVGLGAYGMDSHHVQRYVDAKGNVRNEGDVEVPVAGPYPISYRSIVPKAAECTNLFAPVCMSASHIAYGSIRMEPVFMILGQSAATAAVLALDAGVDVQRVDYPRLRERLLADGQTLKWTGPLRKPARAKK